MNTSTRSYLIGLKDGFGRPYLKRERSEGNSAPFSKIMGFPIVLNQAIPSYGRECYTPILLGMLCQCLHAPHGGRGVPQLLRLNERWMPTRSKWASSFTPVSAACFFANLPYTSPICLHQAGVQLICRSHRYTSLATDSNQSCGLCCFHFHLPTKETFTFPHLLI